MDGAISSFAKFIDARLRSNLSGRVPGRIRKKIWNLDLRLS